MAYSSVKVYGYSGYSGYSGAGGSGYSGYSGGGSGYSGLSGKSGYSGYSGYSGKSGYSGYSGIGQWALSFDGTAGQTAVSSVSLGEDTVTIGTMECWFRTSTDHGSDSQTLIGNYATAGPNTYGIEILFNTSNSSLRVNWQDNHDFTGTTSSAFNDGQWHHLAVTWSAGSNVVLWFDGVQIGSGSMVVSNIDFSGVVFRINGGFAAGFDINEVRVSAGVQRYTSTFTPPRGFFTVDGSTRGYWQVNDGSGQTVRDSGISGYDLSISSYFNLPAWIRALNRVQGYSGVSGYSGYSGSLGTSGYSGYSGYSGVSGYSGYSGYSGKSGYSGYSGLGVSGYSGYSGSGTSGYSGYSGYSGVSGYSGYSGYSGKSGYSGYSGYSGTSGYSGYSGKSGYSGYSGNTAGEFSGLIELPTLNKTYTLIAKTPYNTRLLSFVGLTGSGYLYADLYYNGTAITGYSGKYIGYTARSGYSGTPYTMTAGSPLTMMISGFSTSPIPYDFRFTLGFDQEGT